MKIKAHSSADADVLFPFSGQELTGAKLSDHWDILNGKLMFMINWFNSSKFCRSGMKWDELVKL